MSPPPLWRESVGQGDEIIVSDHVLTRRYVYLALWLSSDPLSLGRLWRELSCLPSVVSVSWVSFAQCPSALRVSFVQCPSALMVSFVIAVPFCSMGVICCGSTLLPWTSELSCGRTTHLRTKEYSILAVLHCYNDSTPSLSGAGCHLL